LLDAFETGPRWIVVREISLARNADVPGSVQARMSIATYFADEESGRSARPAPPAAAPRAARKGRS
jgi:hypothetical protein